EWTLLPERERVPAPVLVRKLALLLWVMLPVRLRVEPALVSMMTPVPTVPVMATGPARVLTPERFLMLAEPGALVALSTTDSPAAMVMLFCRPRVAPICTVVSPEVAPRAVF